MKHEGKPILAVVDLDIIDNALVKRLIKRGCIGWEKFDPCIAKPEFFSVSSCMDSSFMSGKTIAEKKHPAPNHLIIKPLKVLAKNLARHPGLFVEAIDKGHGFDFLVLSTKSSRVFRIAD